MVFGLYWKAKKITGKGDLMMKETRFKDTEIGRIPEDWELVRLGDILTIGNGMDYKHLAYGNVPVYGTGGFMTFVNHYLYDGETVCIGRKGTIDNPIYHEGKIWTVDTLFYTKEFKNSFPKFIFYLFKTLDWYKYNEATGVPSLSKINIENIIVQLPIISEQHRIASALTSIDNLISSLDKLIEKKKNIKQGTMQQLLTGKKRLKGFTEPWEEKKLGEILQYEQPTKYLVIFTDYAENGVPVLTAGKTFILGYTKEETGVYNNIPVIIFDDFVTESKYVDFPFKAKSSAMKMLSLRDGLHNLRFVYEIMQLIDFPMTDHKRYWIGQYSQLLVKVPCIEEQNEITNVLTSMDNEISALEAKRMKYETIKQGMMQQLLTGKIRLTDAQSHAKEYSAPINNDYSFADEP